MHRDLRVGNVLYIGDDFLLGDFGTAKASKTYTLHTGQKGILQGKPQEEAFPDAAGRVTYTIQHDMYYYGDLLLALLCWAAGEPEWARAELPWEQYYRNLLKAHSTEAAVTVLSALSVDCSKRLDLRPTVREVLARLGTLPA